MDTTITVRNCHFAAINTGILASTLNSKLLVKDSYFSECATAPISIANRDTTITGNQFVNSGPIITPTAVTPSRVSISGNHWFGSSVDKFLDTSPSDSVTQLIFSNNQIQNDGAVEFVIDDVRELIISGNSIDSGGQILFTCSSDSRNAAVTGNVITATGNGVTMFSIAGDNFLIANNILKTSDGVGIIDILGAANNTRVFGNSFLDVSHLPVDFSTAVSDAGTGSVVGTVGPTGETGATGEIGPDSYTPGNGADWQDPDPATVTEALDRMAAHFGETGPVAP
jgi:hypothetical protein